MTFFKIIFSNIKSIESYSPVEGDLRKLCFFRNFYLYENTLLSKLFLSLRILELDCRKFSIFWKFIFLRYFGFSKNYVSFEILIFVNSKKT